MTKDAEFIKEYKISPEVWKAAKVKKEILVAIEKDYLCKIADLRNSATYLANVLQTIHGVHSVRWRIKDPKHLVMKIVRKSAAGVDKYNSITSHNYHDVVTDLIGIRAIHLFKEDLKNIDSEVREKWDTYEVPTIYIRDGDSENIAISGDYKIEKHEFGYRSAHYIIESKPLKQKVLAELQVRTIFEEGWSEIDHTLRYPNHTDNPDIKSSLTIFNRMAGSADEIASFTLKLKNSIETFNDQLDSLRSEADQARTERDTSLKNMDEILKELQEHKDRGSQYVELVSKLQSEVDTLKNNNSDTNTTVQTVIDQPIILNPRNSTQNGAAILAAIAALAFISK
jgi:putative GTP pyrophosphokinase